MSFNPHFGAILAGGKSRRFGSSKAHAVLGSRTILERTVATHLKAGLSTIVVADEVGRFPDCDVRVITDLVAGVGPLGGLLTALRFVHGEGGLGACVTGCDVPFIESGVLSTLVSSSPGHEAVIVHDEAKGGPQPLVGWYSVSILPVIEDAIANRDLAMHRLLDRLGTVKLLRTSKLPLTKPASVAFLNVNTPDDLELARQYLEADTDP